jgi:hypothetical protein
LKLFKKLISQHKILFFWGEKMGYLHEQPDLNSPAYDWIRSIVIVGFDLDIGQCVENVYGYALTKEEEMQICSFSFPDSASLVMMNTVHTFTIKRLSSPESGEYEQTFFCFSHFRQEEDTSIRRNYYQKGLIIVSHLPLISFFNEVIIVCGEVYHPLRTPISKLIFEDMNKWEAPYPGFLCFSIILCFYFKRKILFSFFFWVFLVC